MTFDPGQEICSEGLIISSILIQTMNTKRITMLVDDCSIDNFVNKKMILSYQFAETVIVFKNSTKAMEYLRKVDTDTSGNLEIPDIIFLDMNMPVLNGEDFLSEFDALSDKTKKHCRVVILSGSIDSCEVKRLSKNSHVIKWISKPLIKQNFDLLERILGDLAVQFHPF
jgi:response regulator RpfG family c-di-GMP phosphodiesterase